MMKYLVIGAHPDDPDYCFGGTALVLCRAGHCVKFVSMTNGDRGHHLMAPEALAARRYEEAQKAARFSGVSEYVILPNHDTELLPSLENRRHVIRLIREFAPDVVVTHRSCDYHPDHRAVAQIVMDAAFLIGVPHCCPETPALRRTPVFCCAYDAFRKPAPFHADALVDISAEIDRKADLLLCHDSQFMEWLPWIDLGMNDFNKDSMSLEEKRAFLKKYYWLHRFQEVAQMYRDLAIRYYGHELAYAEAFEISEYGAPVEPASFQKLMTGMKL